MQQAGLSRTAQNLREELIKVHLNLDEVIAKEITEAIRQINAVPASYKLGIGSDITLSQAVGRYNIIALLQQVRDKAKKAGYDKTADATSHCLVNLRGWMQQSSK